MKYNNIPAFPSWYRVYECGVDKIEHLPGMTLRDYFAGQALAGLTTSQSNDGEWMWGDPGNVAEKSYEIADAMLKEREK